MSRIIDRFVDRIFDDLMIGFHFRKSDRERVKRFEFQHAAEWLGAETKYEGRALRAAHQARRITGGQFMRRLLILREVLNEFDLESELIDAWISHQESLRGEIVVPIHSGDS